MSVSAGGAGTKRRRDGGCLWEYVGPRRGAKSVLGAPLPGCFTGAEAKGIFDALEPGLRAEPERTITVYGKSYREGRLVQWFSRDGHGYQYSGIKRESQGWPQIMEQLSRKAEELTGETGFDSALVNYYKDGTQKMGLHRDNDAKEGFICSFSFGATRTFEVKFDPIDKTQSAPDGKTRLEQKLEDGSAFIMKPGMQLLYKHGIRPESKISAARINVTMRQHMSETKKAAVTKVLEACRLSELPARMGNIGSCAGYTLDRILPVMTGPPSVTADVTVHGEGVKADEAKRRELEDAVGMPIHYLDPHVVVVEKPYGLNTIPGNQLIKPEKSEASVQIPAKGDAGKVEGDVIAPTLHDAGGAESVGSSRKRRRKTHQELWIELLQTAHEMDVPDEHAHLRPLLPQLSKHKTVPRKRRVFSSWASRTLKVVEQDTLDSLFNLLKARFEEKEGTRMDSVLTRLLPSLPEARPVHRLDCETSGLCVLALSVDAARDLSRQFKEKMVQKSYVAVVKGRAFEGQRGELLFPIRPDPVLRPKQMVDLVNGKESRTIFEVISHDAEAGTSRVRLIPYTGRTHQLRIHLACTGRPIVGDSLYNAHDEHRDAVSYVKYSAMEEVVKACDIPAGSCAQDVRQGLLLHAELLSFRHPVSGETPMISGTGK